MVTRTASYLLGQTKVSIYERVCIAFLSLYDFHNAAEFLCACLFTWLVIEKPVEKTFFCSEEWDSGKGQDG